MSSMMPPDIAGMMGGAAPQPAAGGLPPEIAALMGGGGAPPEEAPLPGITDGTHGGGEEALTAAIDMIQAAIDAEADQEDVAVMLKAQVALQQILAKNQSEADKGLGGAVNPKAIRKQAEAGMGV